MKDREVKEFEWYLRDHFFRKSNQGIVKFKKETLAEEIINSYLRYRNSDIQMINEILTIVMKNLISRRVIQEINADLQSIELTGKLSRLQCSDCFYISYLSINEARSCLRCSSNGLVDFPRKINR